MFITFRPEWFGDSVGVKRCSFGMPFVQGLLDPTLGVRIWTDLTVEAIENGAEAVQVTLSNGEVNSYDLLVAADGIGSRTRTMLFPEAPKPQFSGQLSIHWMAPGPKIDGEGWYLSPVGRLGFYDLPQGYVYVPAVMDVAE